MAWDELFADLESSAEAWEQRERDAEIAERTRSAWSQVGWAERCVGSRVSLRVDGLGSVDGEVDTVARTWLLLRAGGAVDWVVALDAVLGVVGAPASPAARARGGEVAARMGWTNAWTVLVRDHAVVQVVRRDGSRVDGLPVRVGEDFVELRVSEDRSRTEIVPFGAVVAVRCQR
ncbi:hypothetical protein [Solicola sp. PLA-1-18]|uniref:hypothetical protein n=1 Tax=Solicola sp. PLA-1-18 TaxID=3380532 RepID=UPI003B7A5E1D